MKEILKKLEDWKVIREVDDHNETNDFRLGYVKAVRDAINLIKNHSEKEKQQKTLIDMMNEDREIGMYY